MFLGVPQNVRFRRVRIDRRFGLHSETAPARPAVITRLAVSRLAVLAGSLAATVIAVHFTRLTNLTSVSHYKFFCSVMLKMSIIKKPKVLIVTTSFPLQEDSVSGIFVERLVRALSQYYPINIITPCGNKSYSKVLSLPYVLNCFCYAPCSWQILAHSPGGIISSVRRNRFLGLLVPSLLLSMFLSCLCHSKDQGIIFANWSICGLIAGLVGRLRGIPVVTTLRGSDVNLVKDSFFSKNLLRATLTLSDRTVTVSIALAKILAHRYPNLAKRILMIPNGIGEDLLTLQRLPTHSEIKLRLVFIGNLIPLKGVDTILNALAALPADIGLKIVGNGHERQSLEVLCIKLGIEKRAEFIGVLPPSSIPAVLQDSDVLVLASYSEGRPNVVLESMAAGLAVIATRIEGTSELIAEGETGLLFPPGDHQALGACIEKLYYDPSLCQKMGEKGRQWIKDQGLLWQNTAATYASLFDEVIAEYSRK